MSNPVIDSLMVQQPPWVNTPEQSHLRLPVSYQKYTYVEIPATKVITSAS